MAKHNRPYAPVAKSIRSAWIQKGIEQGYKFLVITVTDSYPFKFQAVFVEQNTMLFQEIHDSHLKSNSNVVEVYNLNYDIDIQTDRQLLSDVNLDVYRSVVPLDSTLLIPECLNECIPIPYTDVLVAQFDLSHWFQTGLEYSKQYMIIVRHDTLYHEYYPIYVNRDCLFDAVSSLQHKTETYVVEVYNLWFDFREQYMNRVYSILPKPKRYFRVREEKIPLFLGNRFLDNVRRRIWEYIMYCTAEGKQPGAHTYNAAFELMSYCYRADKENVQTMLSMLMKAIASFPSICENVYKAQPFYVILNNNSSLPLAVKSIGQNLRLSNPHERQFCLSCMYFTAPSVDSDRFADIIPWYIRKDYNIRTLLSVFRSLAGDIQGKSELIQEWSMIPEISHDNMNEIIWYQSDYYAPNPVKELLRCHWAYSIVYYIGDELRELAIHNDPVPDMNNPWEFRIIRKKADSGDLNAMLLLGAALMFGIRGHDGEHKEALKWLKQVSRHEHPTAYILLGDAYRRGCGVKKDHAKAVEFYHKAIELDYILGYYNMALMYSKRRGVHRDLVKALAYYIVANEVLDDFFDDIEEQISNLRSKLTDKEVRSATELANSIIPKIRIVENEPYRYLSYPPLKKRTGLE